MKIDDYGAESKMKKDDEQFKKDLKANEDASDKLDKELNEPKKETSINPLSPEDVKEEKKTPKQRILEEFGGLEANIPKYHHYWQLPD